MMQIFGNFAVLILRIGKQVQFYFTHNQYWYDKTTLYDIPGFRGYRDGDS